jgi:capsular polysaccharide biosynthesis protein
VELEGPTLIKNLLFVSKSQDSGWIHPKDVEEIRNFPHFKQALAFESGSSSVYASRRNTKRSPRNEALIETEFQKNGFDVIALEELNFMDEIKVLGKVKNFAGVHGSAHINAIFMPESAKLLDIVNENYWTELGQRIADIRKQTYLPVLFPGTPKDPVDLELIQRGIESFETK